MTGRDPTIPLYVRLPAALHARLMLAAEEGQSWKRKGAIQRLVISALDKALAPTAPAPKKGKGK